MSSGYIYLLQPLRSIIDNKNIYKIGKTKRNNYKRFNEYPNGSILLLQSSCNNCDLMEKHLLKLFDERFVKETDYGKEYFNGDLIEMKKLINNEIINENNDLDLSDNFLVEKCELLDNLQKVSENYVCEKCNFTSCKKYDYNRHCLTVKHRNAKESTFDKLTCKNCNKTYNSRNGLWLHLKNCSNYLSSNKVINNIADNPVIDTNLIMKLIQQNDKLQNFLMQQSDEKTKLINKLSEKTA